MSTKKKHRPKQPPKELSKEQRSQRLFKTIGLCKRAGLLKAGAYSVEETVKAGKAKLVAVAADSSENSKKKYKNLCEYHKVPRCEVLSKESLGKAVGREYAGAVCITDAGLAEKVMEYVTAE